jgi:hypothetical protein
MMANYDIMCFLEYYADRANVLDPISGKRAPTRKWQNFYQVAQEFTIDTDIDGSYVYLPFDADGFGSSEAGSINDLSVNLAAIGDVVDLTESAMAGDTLVIASLVIQDVGQDSFDGSSAQIISRYIGSIESAGISDTTVTWSINPAIDKIKAQIPSRKVSSDLIGRFVGQ